MDVNLFIESNTEKASATDQILQNAESCDMISIPVKKYNSLLQSLKQTDDRAKEAEEQLQQALLDLHQMRQV